MWVVKIGGSLARDPQLLPWLELLCSPREVPLVIVPGGGGFADAVRAHQAQWRFDDRAAHAMALLAMAQFGTMLQALAPALRIVTSAAAVEASRAAQRTMVWLPLDLVDDAQSIEASWRVTSDSLAAWLARELRASRLCVIKSCEVRDRTTEDLARSGIVDAAFPAFVQDAPFGVEFFARSDVERMRASLRDAERVAFR